MSELDLEMTLEDSEYGFGIDATMTDPDGESAVLTVQSGDIHLLLNPDTDVPVSNRIAHISIRISSLTAAGLGIPSPQPDQNLNPWSVEFPDAVGLVRKFTVSKSEPDRTLGIVTVILELLED